LVLSSTCHFLTGNSLQSADKLDQEEMRAVVEKPRDAVVKFDTYQNLQRHRVVLPCDNTASCFKNLKARFFKATFHGDLRPMMAMLGMCTQVPGSLPVTRVPAQDPAPGYPVIFMPVAVHLTLSL